MGQKASDSEACVVGWPVKGWGPIFVNKCGQPFAKYIKAHFDLKRRLLAVMCLAFYFFQVLNSTTLAT